MQSWTQTLSRWQLQSCPALPSPAPGKITSALHFVYAKHVARCPPKNNQQPPLQDAHLIDGCGHMVDNTVLCMLCLQQYTVTTDASHQSTGPIESGTPRTAPPLQCPTRSAQRRYAAAHPKSRAHVNTQHNIHHPRTTVHARANYEVFNNPACLGYLGSPSRQQAVVTSLFLIWSFDSPRQLSSEQAGWFEALARTRTGSLTMNKW